METTKGPPTWAVVAVIIVALLALLVAGNAFVASQPIVGVVAVAVAVAVLGALAVSARRGVSGR